MKAAKAPKQLDFLVRVREGDRAPKLTNLEQLPDDSVLGECVNETGETIKVRDLAPGW